MNKMNQEGSPSYTSPPYHPHPQPPPSYPEPKPPPPSQPQPIFMPGLPFGENPQSLICPYCHANITTSVETGPNTKTHLIALLLCAIGCWCCVPIPYCKDSCQVQKHSCPACRAYLGSSEN